LDEVARERRYLLLVEAPPMESVVEFVRGNIREGVPQFVAVDEGTVVGWCDIRPHPHEGMRHFGVLGMGVVASHRGQGIGNALLGATIEAAESAGMTRIEAEVFASNERSMGLYGKHGFVEEGVKRAARCVDGGWDNFVVMARVTGRGDR
jgi:L-amino acid N-acyltransferase YncA